MCQVPSSLAGLLSLLAPCFTQPSLQTFGMLVVGFLGRARDCTITDISDGGVKVVAEFLEVPPQFTIIFAPDYSRQCRLRWRIGCEFGAEFTD